MTLNGVMAVILPYFSEFGYLSGVLRKSSRSLSHLLMSSCKSLVSTTPQKRQGSKNFKMGHMTLSPDHTYLGVDST